MESNRWEPVIGLEIHAQLKTKSKMFSPDGAQFSDEQNNQIHPISLGHPGTLPALNKQALFWAVKTAKAFNGNIKSKNRFARKNYFYPDLPKGYQISQSDKPFCEGGEVKYYLEGNLQKVDLERIHMEEDAGRSLHKGTATLINFNRAGVPLLEIVTKPDIKTPESAAACVKTIRRVLRYLEVCDGNLEEGSLRCDCNVSIRKKNSKTLGTRVEIKNINSFRFIEKALKYEIQRQINCLESDEPIYQETRLYDSSKDKTQAMRSKEGASDYRYFTDPDFPRISFEADFLNQIRLPELAFEKAERFQKEYQLPISAIDLLVEDKYLADYFEKVVLKTKSPEITSHWIIGELQAFLKESHLNIKQCPITTDQLAELICFINQGDISNKMAKDIFDIMWKTQKNPKNIIEEKNLKQISDESILAEWVDKVLLNHPKQVEDYQGGRTKVFGFFVGQIMKETKGQAHPEKVAQLLKKRLKD